MALPALAAQLFGIRDEQRLGKVLDAQVAQQRQARRREQRLAADGRGVRDVGDGGEGGGGRGRGRVEPEEDVGGAGGVQVWGQVGKVVEEGAAGGGDAG